MALCRMATHGDPQARAYAMALEEALGVISSYDEGPDLVLYYKYLMALEGHEGYENHFNPTDTLTPSQQSQAHAQWKMFKAWWSRWEGASYQGHD